MALGRIHHLDCGTMCPVAASLVGSPGRLWNRGHFVCHCFLIESDEGLILVESGLGAADLGKDSRLPLPFRLFNAPSALGPTARMEVERLGFAVSDVRHIFLTHLDLDHAGGIEEFPDATVHVYEREFDAAMAPAFGHRHRYVAAQWAHGPKWNKIPDHEGESWFGFNSVFPLPGFGEDLALVPLVGHSAGSCGVAVRGTEGWLMHCGDAFFHRDELQPDGKAPLGIRMFQRRVDFNYKQRVDNTRRLRELKRDHGDEILLVCSHDPVQLQELQAAPK